MTDTSDRIAAAKASHAAATTAHAQAAARATVALERRDEALTSLLTLLKVDTLEDAEAKLALLEKTLDEKLTELETQL